MIFDIWIKAELPDHKKRNNRHNLKPTPKKNNNIKIYRNF